MKLDKWHIILDAFELRNVTGILPIGKGHINKSFKISTSSLEQQYVLQQINTSVFKQPFAIAANWEKAQKYLSDYFPDYKFLSFIKTKTDEPFFVDNENNSFWRLLPFISGKVYEHSNSLKTIVEAASAYGKFTALTTNIDTRDFQEIIKDFHNAKWRWQQFNASVNNADQSKIKKAEKSLDEIFSYEAFIEQVFQLQQGLPSRLQHMDAKLGNVIFLNNTIQNTQLLDLDTLMPGTILSDTGDMIRSMAATASEEETDLTKVFIDPKRYQAVFDGWFKEIKSCLKNSEKELFGVSGKMIILIQALRFMTDFLMGNVYYPVNYEDHNLKRAENQLKLLQSLNVLTSQRKLL